MSTPGVNLPKPITARHLSMGDVRLVDGDGNILTDHTQLAYVPVYANVEAEATVQLEGIYDAATNPNPDNVGIIVHRNNAAPGDPQQTVRTTGGVSSPTIISTRFFGLDTRSKLYAVEGANEQELDAITIGGGEFGLGVGVFDADGDRLEIDGYGNILVNVDGVYNALDNQNPDNVGLIVHQNNVAPGDPQQIIRTTGGVSNITIASNTFYGADTRSKVYGQNGTNERAWEMTADGYGIVDPLIIRGNEDLAAPDAGAQVMIEARDSQKAAVDTGDSVRAVGNLYGEQVSAGYTWATNSNRVEEINPLDQKYVGPETLVGAAQDLTAAFADLGAEIPMSGYKKLGVWLTIDINDSENARIKALAKHTSGGSEEYNLPIESIAPDVITIQDEYYEFNDDSDQLVLLTIETNNIVPYIQLQVEAGVVGGTAGQIDKAYITKAY